MRKPEPLSLYLAVLTLRRRGYIVHRAWNIYCGPRGHWVDGKRVSGKMLAAMAERER